MYYSYTKNFRGKTYRFAAISFLFIIILLTIFQSSSFAVIEFGKESEEYRSIGYKAQQEGDFDRALTFYSKALSIGEEDAWIYNNIGVIYEQMGLIDKAEMTYLKALKIDSNYLPVYTNLAFLYKERGDIPRAISYLRTRIEHAPQDDEWLPVLIEELNALDPAYRENMVVKQLEEMDQRLYQMAKEELSLNVARADGHYRNAKELVGQNNFEEAVEEIDRALALTPNNPKLTKMRANVLYGQRIFDVKRKVDKAVGFFNSGDMDSARQEFQGILTILPGEFVQE